MAFRDDALYKSHFVIPDFKDIELLWGDAFYFENLFIPAQTMPVLSFDKTGRRHSGFACHLLIFP
jgi:hypothetical protein